MTTSSLHEPGADPNPPRPVSTTDAYRHNNNLSGTNYNTPDKQTTHGGNSEPVLKGILRAPGTATADGAHSIHFGTVANDNGTSTNGAAASGRRVSFANDTKLDMTVRRPRRIVSDGAPRAVAQSSVHGNRAFGHDKQSGPPKTMRNRRSTRGKHVTSGRDPFIVGPSGTTTASGVERRGGGRTRGYYHDEEGSDVPIAGSNSSNGVMSRKRRKGPTTNSNNNNNYNNSNNGSTSVTMNGGSRIGYSSGSGESMNSSRKMAMRVQPVTMARSLRHRKM